MIKVYVDTGGEMPGLKHLRAQGLAESVHFPYEQRLKRIDTTARPSKLTWSSAATWSDLEGVTWNDTGEKPMHVAIAKVIGAQNKADVQHLASAHDAGCDAMLTSDRGDIWRHRDELHALLGIRIFHSSAEWADFVALCETRAS